jgi:hypothetical protein
MKKLLLPSLVFFLTLSAYADTPGQTMPDQDPNYDAFNEQYKETSSDSPFLIGDRQGDFESDEVTSHAVPGSNIPNANLQSDEKFNVAAPGTYDNATQYLEIDRAQQLREIRSKGKWNFGFIYIKDDFEYKDPSNIFRKTYEDSTGSVKGGLLQISMSKYFTKRWVYLGIGMNGAVGYNNGKGIFVNNEQSNASFTLWTLPLDLTLSLDIPVTKYFQLSATGGPSFMGLIQNRSDRDSGEAYKQRRQFSYGYFYGGRFKISLASVFRESAIKMFSHYDITNYFLTLESRFQNYENFQDDLSISGASFGVGFTFEYL